MTPLNIWDEIILSCTGKKAHDISENMSSFTDRYAAYGFAAWRMHLSTIDKDNDYLKHFDKIFEVIEEVRKLSFIAKSNHMTTWPGVNGLAKNSILRLSDRQFRVPFTIRLIVRMSTQYWNCVINSFITSRFCQCKICEPQRPEGY